MKASQKYKIEKKIKKGDLTEDVDIINCMRTEKNIFLPIEQYAKELLYTIEQSNVTIVMGETGCGKTTKIPEILYRSSTNFRIAHILPRKIATITVAERVAKNMGLSLGKEVGYSVRFDYNYSDQTKIKFLTEGMFIRELLMDPLLNNYNVIIIDDCHERTINSELILGVLKKLSNKRKEMKIVISSATLDYQCYLNYFSKDEGFNSNIFVIKGRTFPVQIYYLEKPVKNYIEAAVITASNIHKNNEKNSGDILVFLTGQEDINIFLECSTFYGLDKSDIILLPLCAGLSVDKQLDVFAPTPHNKRKIVVSTNIAEASVTIDNIAFVIDCGLVKMKFYNSKIDSDALYIIPTSKYSMDQRAGRAGRTRPGQCFRLMTETSYNNLYMMTNPELLRSNLIEFILRLKSIGVKNIKKFETITTPDQNTIARALENLFFLGIIDDSTILTELGLKVCDLPIDPRLAVALLKSAELKFKCVEEVLIIVSMLSIQNLFYQPKDHQNLLKAKQRFGVIEGDHLTLLSIYKQYKHCKTSKSKFCKDIYLNEHLMKQVDEIINNLKPYLKKYNLSIISSLDNDGEDIIKSFLKGFYLNIAQKQIDGSYRSLRWNIPLYIHPTSVLYTIMPEYVLYNEVVSTAKNYIKDVSKIDKNWVMEVASNYYEDKAEKIIKDRHKEEIIAQYQQKPYAIKEEKSNITKHLQKSEERFKNKVEVKEIKKEENRIYMDLDKNKDFSHYFENSDEEKNEVSTKNKSVKVQAEKSINPNETSKGALPNEEEIEEITMLRRMRKRK